jgi:hypothetical protein
VPTSSTDPAWANDKSLVTRLHFNTGAVNNTGGCYTPSTYSSTSTVNAAGDPIAPYGMGRAMAGFLYAGLERTGYADVACPGCDDENLACKIAAGCDFDESWAANNRTNLLADLAGRTDWQRSPYFVETYYELPALVDGVRAEGTIRYFDLDESVRFAVSNHLSMFNMKNAFIPAGDRILATGLVQDPEQGGLPLGWCDCDASGSDNCVVRQVERLLVETGQRLSISTMSWRAGRIGQPLAVGVDLRNRGNAPPYHHARPAVRLVRNGTPGAWVLADASARDVLPPPLKCVPSWADRTTQACVDDLDFSNSPTAWPYACNTIGEAEATPRVTRLLFTVPATAISAAGAHTLQFAWLDAAGAPGAVDMAMAPDATGAWYTLGNVTVTN